MDRMMTLSKLSLPLSTDFGNANFSTQGQRPLMAGSHARIALCTNRMMEVERRPWKLSSSALRHRHPEPAHSALQHSRFRDFCEKALDRKHGDDHAMGIYVDHHCNIDVVSSRHRG
jgi:hypothetical protein